MSESEAACVSAPWELPGSGTACGGHVRAFLSTTLYQLLSARHRSEVVVNPATVRDFNNEDKDLVVVNICEDPVVARTVTPEILIHELLAQKARIIQLRKLLLEKTTDSSRDHRTKLAHLFRSFRCESDRVAHTRQTTAARSIASSFD